MIRGMFRSLQDEQEEYEYPVEELQMGLAATMSSPNQLDRMIFDEWELVTIDSEITLLSGSEIAKEEGEQDGETNDKSDLSVE